MFCHNLISAVQCLAAGQMAQGRSIVPPTMYSSGEAAREQ